MADTLTLQGRREVPRNAAFASWQGETHTRRPFPPPTPHPTPLPIHYGSGTYEWPLAWLHSLQILLFASVTAPCDRIGFQRLSKMARTCWAKMHLWSHSQKLFVAFIIKAICCDCPRWMMCFSQIRLTWPHDRAFLITPIWSETSFTWSDLCLEKTFDMGYQSYPTGIPIHRNESLLCGGPLRH